MSRAPPPSSRCFLADLPDRPNGDKVRFLGCVMAYDHASAILILEHAYPTGNGVKALVDIRLLLNKVKEEQTRIGEWVNVIGYAHPAPGPESADSDKDRGLAQVPVQGLSLWSTGPLDISEYEKCLANDMAHLSSPGRLCEL